MMMAMIIFHPEDRGAWCSQTFVSYHITTQCQNQQNHDLKISEVHTVPLVTLKPIIHHNIT